MPTCVRFPSAYVRHSIGRGANSEGLSSTVCSKNKNIGYADGYSVYCSFVGSWEQNGVAAGISKVRAGDGGAGERPRS